jgi:hypothetical protein
MQVNKRSLADIEAALAAQGLTITKRNDVDGTELAEGELGKPFRGPMLLKVGGMSRHDRRKLKAQMRAKGHDVRVLAPDPE